MEKFDMKTLFDEKGELKPGFSGIGRLRGKTEYTQDEKTIIEYFFTNSNSNVYCAKDTMPGELWALILGQYARSNLTARDRLLKLFKDMEKKGTGITIAEFAKLLRSNTDVSEVLETYLRKAGSFIEKWGVKYGHASLRDSGVIRICFEGVSQYATNILESAREGAYQEQSTRALPYKIENIGIPYEIQGTKFEQSVYELNQEIIEFYDRLYARLFDHFKKRFSYMKIEAEKKLSYEIGSQFSGGSSNQDERIEFSEREWDGIIAAKTFDVARYMIPQNMTTSLGMTLNTRRFQDMLTEWQSHETEEIRVLGRVAQIESMKISPSLMKYGNPSEYHKCIRPRVKRLNRKYVEMHSLGSEFEYKHYNVSSKLISCTEDLQELVLASILFNGSDGSRSILELKEIVKGLSFQEKREIAESAIKDRLGYEVFSKSMECGNVIFERLYDIGAFRDLQRQRGDRQQWNRFSVIGYNMPPEIEEVGMKIEFENIMNKIKMLYDEFCKHDMYAVASYLPVMANILRHISMKDPVQCFYEAKLRTQPAGIDSYRDICQQEIKQLLEKMPVFKGLIPYDANYYHLGRLPETVRMKKDSLKRKKV